MAMGELQLLGLSLLISKWRWRQPSVCFLACVTSRVSPLTRPAAASTGPQCLSFLTAFTPDVHSNHGAGMAYTRSRPLGPGPTRLQVRCTMYSLSASAVRAHTLRSVHEFPNISNSFFSLAFWLYFGSQFHWLMLLWNFVEASVETTLSLHL
jgi:hypothetical protein